MRTKTDLIRATMQNGGYLGADETVSDADSAAIELRYDTKLAEWRRLGFVWWVNTSLTVAEIPDDVFAVMSQLMLNEVMPLFGTNISPTDQEAAEQRLLRKLRRLNHKPQSGEPTRSSHF
jgi:hypothetical protein